ncbi:MAG: excinuclease ABC subunit UvrC [Alphaproteobacteria bacterium]|nr:excinuclease ABC subunit UvrC [Alphaproteobacteria bacterium]
MGQTGSGTDQDALTDGKPGAGLEVIVSQLRTMPGSPGVYRMLDGAGRALYVGKAKNLRKRVVAYTRLDQLPARLQRMVFLTASMEVITTHTEAEALLLESNLIKRLKPHYNILLRDDKSFPYILITGGHEWARIVKHRGARSLPGEYFGPFASAGAVNQALSILQRAFLLRSCTDGVFASRTRPCLLHQIKRCSAPCAGRIEPSAYAALVEEARAFLSARSSRIQQDLAARMEEASGRLEFEAAAVFRDRIRALSSLQARQDIDVPDFDDGDVLALHQAGGQACIQVFFFRGGHNCGNRAYFPAHVQDEEPGTVLAAFIGQFYDDKSPPHDILLSHSLPEADLIGEALSLKAARKGARVRLLVPRRGPRRNLVDNAMTNAREALGRRLAESGAQRKLLEATAEVFSLDGAPERIEVYDNSHVSGAHAVGAMIVAGAEGLLKSAYRTFAFKSADLRPGDDYAMMREVLTRRFRRALKEDPDRVSQWPDLVLIDGGRGHLGVALEVLDELGIDALKVVAVAKGPDRDAGHEQFHTADAPPFSLPANDPVLYFLQRLRDEAHRFAIGTHRARRSRAIGASPLDDISGIGARRKKALLHHFGSARAVAEAGLADLEAVEGISGGMAKKIYDRFHPGG